MFKDCCVQGKFALVFLKWGVTNKMEGMTFCMKYIIRGGGVLINGNGYAKFPKNGVYSPGTKGIAKVISKVIGYIYI